MGLSEFILSILITATTARNLDSGKTKDLKPKVLAEKIKFLFRNLKQNNITGIYREDLHGFSSLKIL